MNAPAARPVRVRVPGSTSNCGAGFDTLGLAVTLYNTVEVEAVPGERPAGPAFPIGPGAVAVARMGENWRAGEMAAGAARAWFEAAGIQPFSFVYGVEGDVPAARGLGSSVTVIAGIIAGLNALCGEPLTRARLVGVATAEEGHPDNASAGILGGFCVSRCDPATGAYRDTLRFVVPDSVALVVASPEIELLTRDSRGVLPAALPYFDAVKSVNSAAYVVAAFASGEYQRLRDAAGDFLHEPYRLPRIAGAAAAIAAGVRAGAWTGWLSGSGSSVLCVAERSLGGGVARAMEHAFTAAGVRSTARVLAADNAGLRVL